jgi:hypothetical protein
MKKGSSMSIWIGNYEFDGPSKNVADLKEKEGVIALLHCQGDAVYELIHVAQADNVRELFELSRSAYSPIDETVLVAACYTPGRGARERSMMVADIEAEFDDKGSPAYSPQPVELALTCR